jgi:2-oxoglutarate dehydrogenase E2 component (dihydrolipoamide succinyltransferase)
MTQILVPVLGESVTEATVAQWLKKEGETVKRDEPIVELETDKVTLEVNAPSDGVISKIMVGEGQNVGVGAILGELSAANDTAKPAAAPAPAPETEATGSAERSRACTCALRQRLQARSPQAAALRMKM